jgi:CubicO group peptidase (beta-lactamase class C family)
LFALLSNTKVLVAATLWTLVEEGRLRFSDTVAEHIPGFDAHGKGEVTVAHLLCHQAGFPNAEVPPRCYRDPEQLRRTICDFRPEWPAGTRTSYHRLSSHWVVAVLIENLTGGDYRDEVRMRIIAPLGLGDQIYLGMPATSDDRAATVYQRAPDGWALDGLEATDEFKRVGIPGGGGYGTAQAMAAFYQMLAQGGTLNGIRILSTRMVEYVTRDFTGPLIDDSLRAPMHRGLGPFSRGDTHMVRGLGAIGHPRTFGHSGAGTSFSWADPTSGVSFSFVSNARHDNSWHNKRMDAISSVIHASILQ